MSSRQFVVTLVLLVALGIAFGYTLKKTTPPRQVLVEVPYEVQVPVDRPTECMTFDLLALSDDGFVRVVQQELCGQAFTWGRMLGPSFDTTLASVENERNAWRECALDEKLCADWQKEQK